MAALPHNRQDLAQFARFIAVGVMNTVVGYLIFAALTLVGLPPTAAVVCATILGVLFNFQSIGRLVFGESAERRLPRFIGIYSVQAIANIVLLHLAIAHGVPVLLAEAILLPLLAVINFLLMRRYVFGVVPAGQGHL